MAIHSRQVEDFWPPRPIVYGVRWEDKHGFHREAGGSREYVIGIIESIIENGDAMAIRFDAYERRIGWPVVVQGQFSR